MIGNARSTSIVICTIVLVAVLGLCGCAAYQAQSTGNTQAAAENPLDLSGATASDAASPSAAAADSKDLASEFTIEIRNASLVDGEAQAIAQSLQGQGYDPTVSTRQADVQEETWVIYKNVSYSAQAHEICDALGLDSAKCGPNVFSFSSDVTVLAGLDWANKYMREEGQDPYLPRPVN